MPRTSFIPGRLGRALLAAAVVTSGVVATSQASWGSGARTYLVRPGDSLWSISQADGISVAALAAANDMSAGDVLLAGRTIVIPGPSSASPGGDAPGGGVAAPAADACADGSGPWGVLPWQLQADSGRRALMPVFAQWADAYGVSPALVEAITWQESGWQQGVVSPAGAIGVGQLLPGTATFVSEDLLGTPLDVHSTEDNIRMTARFVAYLAAVEGGNLCHTIAAYYEGPGNVAAHGLLPGTAQYVADVEALIPRFE